MNNKIDDKVSIVVPIYNREKFLDKCISSIVMQTYKNLEIILVNDGSKDNSLDICKKYAKNDDRIKVIDKENGGVQSARNRGIDEATGKYLCFVDADDYVSEHYIQNFINVYEKENVECVVSGHFRVNDKGDVIAENKDLINLNIPIFQSERWALYFERFACYAWNHMFLLDIVYKHNIRFDDNIPIYDDTAFSMNYVNHIVNIGFTNSNDYYYVCEHNDLTVAKRLKNKRVNDGGCREKTIVCIDKYNYYIKNNDICDNTYGDLMWVSSSLYHIAMISYMLYAMVIPYDYRYNKKTKIKQFDDFYVYIKNNHLENWYYNYDKLHTKLSSIKLLKPFSYVFFNTSKAIFYMFCLIIGNSNIYHFILWLRTIHVNKK